MLKPWMQRLVVTSCVAMALGVASGPRVAAHSSHDLDQDDHQRERTLYIWAGDQERKRPDFLAVIDFDERSPSYGRVLRTVPLPSPGAVGNEPHHCHLSADKNILACGGLLSVLKGQHGIFFFDVSHARHPVFLFGPTGGKLRYHAIVSISFRDKRLWSSVAADRLSEGL
jgi:56kDa selenium binding protein (SBP56)